MASTSISVNAPSGLTYIVNITGVSVFTDSGLTSAATFPADVTSTTTWWISSPPTSAVTVSCRLNGVELLGNQFNVSPVGGLALSPVPTVAQLAAGTASSVPVTYNVKGYGAKGDGVTDDSTAIQAAINDAAAVKGGIVLFPAGTYAIGTVLTGKNGVALIGDGADWGHTVGSVNPPTRLKALTSGMTMASFTGPSTAGSDQAGSGGGVSGVYFDANSLAANGLVVKTWRYGQFSWLGFNAFTTAAIQTGTVAASAGSDDNRGVQQCVFAQIDINDTTGSGDGIVLDGDQGAGPTANTSLNSFRDVSIVCNNGTGLHMKDCDNNAFENLRVYANGTGRAIWFRGGTVTGNHCRSNHFFRATVTGAGTPVVEAEGTGGSITKAAVNNFFWGSDQENNFPAPTIGTAASIHRITDFGVLNQMAAANLVVAADNNTAASEIANVNTAYSLWVRNGSSANIMCTDGTIQARIYVDTNGIHIARVSGGSYVELDGGLKISGTTQYAFGGGALVNIPTGWGAATGTATRTTFDTASVTLPVLAQHVKAIIDDLLASTFFKP